MQDLDGRSMGITNGGSSDLTLFLHPLLLRSGNPVTLSASEHQAQQLFIHTCHLKCAFFFFFFGSLFDALSGTDF